MQHYYRNDQDVHFLSFSTSNTILPAQLNMGNKKESKTLKSVTSVIKEAFENGQINHDLRQRLVPTWVALATPSSTDDDFPDGLSHKPAALKCQLMMPAEKEETPSDSTLGEAPVEDCEIVATPVEEWWPVSPPAPAPAPPESATMLSSPPSPEPPESVTMLLSPPLSKEVEELIEEVGENGGLRGGQGGWGFTWCFECGRMDIARYARKRVRWGLQIGEEGGVDEGIAMICCKTCKFDPENGYSSSDKQVIEQGNLESFQNLRMKGKRWAGIEAEGAAEAIAGTKVPFITDARGGLAYVNIDEIMEGLTVEDTIVSVDMARFWKGQREGLVLPYLVGGLI